LSVTTTTSTTLAVAEPAGSVRFAAPWAVRAAAFLTILLFALTPVTTQLAGHQIPGVTIGVLRVVGSGLFAFPLLLLCRVPIPAETESWTLLIVSALGSFAGFPLLFSIGIRLTSAAHAGLIMATMPLITSILGLAIERHRPRPMWFTGTILAFAGEALLVANGNATPGTVVGDALVLAACMVCACGFAAGGRLAQHIDPLAATLWAIAVASLGFLPAAVLMAPTVDWAALTPVTWVALLHITLGASVLAYVSWFWALSRGGIARVAAFQFAQPALVFVFATLILGESLPAQLLVATLVVFGGIALARRG
jgi:drug/metabolite transporter (DMT)-like permease